MLSCFFSLISLSIQNTCNYTSRFFNLNTYLTENTVYLNYRDRSRPEIIKVRWSSCKNVFFFGGGVKSQTKSTCVGKFG